MGAGGCTHDRSPSLALEHPRVMDSRSKWLTGVKVKALQALCFVGHMLSSTEQCAVLDKLEGSRDILLGQKRNTGKVERIMLAEKFACIWQCWLKSVPGYAKTIHSVNKASNIVKTESNEEERSQGTQLLATITQPLVTASSQHLLEVARPNNGEMRSRERGRFGRRHRLMGTEESCGKPPPYLQLLTSAEVGTKIPKTQTEAEMTGAALRRSRG
ncbi:hypothetical protein Nmel_004681 [Mimus melanotis]